MTVKEGEESAGSDGRNTPPTTDVTTTNESATGDHLAVPDGSSVVLPARQASISEAAELSSGGWTAPRILKWVEIPFRMKDPATGTYLPEATGWAMDGAARGPLNQIGSYVGSAILRLAALQAGCPNPRTCTGTVYGLQPSSLLTLTSTTVGVVAAILMPVFGAIVDHTRHRKLVGILSGLIAVLATGLQIGISAEKNNWLYILILDGIQSFFLLVHSTAVFAYLPDLTLDHSILPAYTAHFNIRQFAAQFTVGGLVILLGQLRGNDKSIESSVKTAQDGAAIAFTYGVVFIGYSWSFCFRKRPALSKVPEGSNLVTTGFKQVWNTSKKIWKNYRALKWFMLSLLLSPEAGNGVILSIAVTFFVFVIRLSTLDVAKLALIVMSGNIVGSFVSRIVCRRFLNPLNSYRVAMTMLGVAIAASVAYLNGPEDRGAALGFSSTWGFFMGWAYPSQRVMFVTLIPKGQETEMMGLFFFMGQILGWLPPLIFTIMNEKGVNMRWGLGVVSFFCVFAVLMTLPMGNYQEAVEFAKRDSEAKFNEVFEKASRHESYVSHKASPRSSKRNSTKDSTELAPPESAEELETVKELSA